MNDLDGIFLDHFGPLWSNDLKLRELYDRLTQLVKEQRSEGFEKARLQVWDRYGVLVDA